MCSGRQGMSSKRLQDVFSVTIFRLPRRLDILKICLQDVLKTCLQDVFSVTKFFVFQDALMTSCEISSRRLQDQKMFAGLTLSCTATDQTENAGDQNCWQNRESRTAALRETCVWLIIWMPIEKIDYKTFESHMYCEYFFCE